MSDPLGGDEWVDVAEVAAAAGVSLTGLLATVRQLGHHGELERCDGVTYLRRWAADACLARIASEKRTP